MTGMELFDKAMELLGYTSAEGLSGKEDMLKRGLTLVNLVYSELYYAFVYIPGGEDNFKPLALITDKIVLPDRVLNDVAPYGMAMYLAQSESDADNQTLYANIYNQKKVCGKSVKTITDRLPHVWG